MKHLKNNNQGFTLVELIVTVAILAVVMVPLFNVFVLSAERTASSQQYGNVTILLENAVEVVKANSVTAMDTALARLGGTVTAPAVLPEAEGLDPDLDHDFVYTIDDVTFGSTEGSVVVTLSTSTTGGTLLGDINSFSLATFVGAYAQGAQSSEASVDPDQIAMSGLKDEVWNSMGQVATDGDILLTGRTMTLTIDSSSSYPAKMAVGYQYYAQFVHNGTTHLLDYTLISPILVTPDGTPDSSLDRYAIFYAYTPMYFAANSSDTSRNGEKVVIQNLEDLPVDLFLVKQAREDYSPNGLFTESYDAAYTCKLELYEATASGSDSHLDLYTNITKSISASGAPTGTFSLNYYVGGALSTPNLDYAEDLVQESMLARFYQVTVDVYETIPGSTTQQKIATMTTYKLE